MHQNVLQQDPRAAREGNGDGERGDMLAAVSTAMVQLYKDLFGRGPTTAKSWLAGPDILFTLLGDSLTTGERALVALGEHARLREQRTFIQYANEERFRSIVERLSGRRVETFISGIDTRTGVSTELFVLAPEPR